MTIWRLRLLNILIIHIALCACSSSPSRAPVSDFKQPPSEKLGYHIVARGETLYSIAWRYNLDYKSLARAYNIGSDFRIYPGQRIELRTQSAPAKPPKAVKNPLRSVPQQVVKIEPPKKPVVVTRSKNQSTQKPKKSDKSASNSPVRWQWPARGKLSLKFHEKNGLHKGIDLSGVLGEPVSAAAPGRVVYSGNGLRGYGKLIIVKHNEKYLSAYAHNRKLLVKEGDDVTAGQKIAEMGSTGTNTVKLHFQIRYDGKPVDPLRYLPKQ